LANASERRPFLGVALAAGAGVGLPKLKFTVGAFPRQAGR
jgi:hypothetical protein